jgi:hypothetical protein
MAQIIHNNSGKRSYRDYIFSINKYLIPFFDEHRASQITQELFAFLNHGLIQSTGTRFYGNTKPKRANAYVRVINLARNRGYTGYN